MKKKILSVIMVVLMSIYSVVPVFAEETNTAKKEDHKIENAISGKITSINANYVNIDVATPKKMEKPEESNATNDSSKKRRKEKYRRYVHSYRREKDYKYFSGKVCW